jgi:hypothetical protein
MRSNLNDPGQSRQSAVVEVTMRIPGVWCGPKEFAEGLPDGCHCTERGLVLADGTEYELNVVPADEEFAGIFAGSCPKLPTEDERERIENYKVNICVTGRGGSLDAARGLMEAAAAVMAAGGAGVFIDNCGLAHGATNWVELLEHADEGGLFWAFVSTVRSDEELYSVGMHILGCRDAVIPATGNNDYDCRSLHSFLGYAAFSGAAIEDGDIVRDAVLPTYHAFTGPDDRLPDSAPMHNPYGRWRLVPYDEARN